VGWVAESANIARTSLGLGTGDSPTFTGATLLGGIKLLEQAAADADTDAYGQLWVKTATPNELWFTDDAGTSTKIV